MPRRQPVRLAVTAMAVLMLLVFATTLGSVWHHHTTSSEATCPICHLNHQPVQRPLTVSRAPQLEITRSSPDANVPETAPAPVIRRLAARAPPSA